MLLENLDLSVLPIQECNAPFRECYVHSNQPFFIPQNGNQPGIKGQKLIAIYLFKTGQYQKNMAKVMPMG